LFKPILLSYRISRFWRTAVIFRTVYDRSDSWRHRLYGVVLSRRDVLWTRLPTPSSLAACGHPAPGSPLLIIRSK